MHQVAKVLRKLYRSVGTPRARELESLLDKGEWAAVQSHRLNSPESYQSADEYFKDALCVEIMRKCLLPGDARARKLKAQETFYACERANALTNARLHRFVEGGPYEVADLPLVAFIERWRAIVKRVLGPVPTELMPSFSGGSTLDHSGMNTTVPDKILSSDGLYAPDLQTQLLYLRSFNGTPMFASRHDWKEHRANRFFTVPKDSEKDRGCCMEASLSLMLQLPLGEHIVHCIERAYQVDFSRLPEYHNWLAAIGSKFGTLATVDLSNASDLLARELVRLVLPGDWYATLNSLRAKFTEIDRKVVRLEKFSSMGNGFTFPLETLLFRTLCEAIGSNCASVFGDDIVIESEHAAALLAALRLFGMEPNKKKTFHQGPFRESCGGDFFLGVPVRAHYLKAPPTHPQHWVALANGLRRVDPDLRFTRAAWHACIDFIPQDFRNFCAEASTSFAWDPSARRYGDVAIYDPSAKPRLHFFEWPDSITLSLIHI